MFTIIEDRSPYYIRFTHDGIQDVIDACLEGVKGKVFHKPARGFHHNKYDDITSNKILALTPISKILDLQQHRVSLFVTEPGYYYKAHKDGWDHRFSINYVVKVLDDKCKTRWYSDEELAEYAVDDKTWQSREIEGDFDKTKHTPLHEMTAQQGECVLFNTEIYHDFDNSKSLNERMVLTLRVNNPGAMYYDDAKKILFGI